MRPDIRIVVALALFASLISTSLVATAQDRRGRRGRTEARAEATAEAGDDAADDEDEDEEIDEGDADARGSEVTEGGQKVKVYNFSGLDISGQLKSPQLLYFLNRMRAEFDRPKLPHRSFMPELQRSARSKGL